MTAEALKRGGGSAGGGSPETMFNQGVTLWNAGKIAEAKAQFEAAAKAKPDYADAHYWVGMANLNEGKMPEAATAFEAYLKLAPTGQYAAQVKTAARADQAAVGARHAASVYDVSISAGRAASCARGRGPSSPLQQ